MKKLTALLLSLLLLFSSSALAADFDSLLTSLSDTELAELLVAANYEMDVRHGGEAHTPVTFHSGPCDAQIGQVMGQEVWSDGQIYFSISLAGYEIKDGDLFFKLLVINNTMSDLVFGSTTGHKYNGDMAFSGVYGNTIVYKDMWSDDAICYEFLAMKAISLDEIQTIDFTMIVECKRYFKNSFDVRMTYSPDSGFTVVDWTRHFSI